MATERKAKTMKLQGNDYAKVAERLKLFREDNPKGKTESIYEYDVDKSLVFTVFLWKDKSDIMELMKAGVVDKDTLRTSSDSNGHARSSEIGSQKKDFEKLETIALGRALANAGYLGSGDIASSEEMERFKEFERIQKDEEMQAAIKSLKAAKTLDELKKAFFDTKMMQSPEVVEAKDRRKKELSSEAN